MRRRSVLRWGIVGCGRIFPYYAQAIVHHPEAELVAVCDKDSGRAIEAMGEYGAAGWHPDYRELTDRKDVDVVAVCTKGADHQGVVARALKNGKFVLCESPVQCEQIGEEGRSRFGAAVPLRYDPAVRALRSAMSDGDFGEVSRAEVKVGKGCGGVVVGALDLLVWMMGEPDRIELLDPSEIPPAADMVLEDAGMPATIRTAALVYRGDRRSYVHIADDTGFGCMLSLRGDAAVAWAHEGKVLLLPMNAGPQQVQTVETLDAPWLMAIYVRMVWDFNSCALSGREYWLGWEWAQNMNRIASGSGLFETMGAEAG
jgi:hypothetical protein